MKNILITCGPTAEPLDPVRFITNQSTGTFGFEIARVFSKKKFKVTLVCGNVTPPSDFKNKKIIFFKTANDLKKILKKEVKKTDILFMSAAVSDFRPKKTSSSKIKRTGKNFKVEFVPNDDVIGSLGNLKKDKIFVGFSVESKNLSKNAIKKIKSKNLDLLVAQKVTDKKAPFGPKPIDSSFYYPSKKTKVYKNTSKKVLANSLLRETLQMLSDKK